LDEASLTVMHATDQRLRLRYPASLTEPELADLLSKLDGEPWVKELRLSSLSRSIVITLSPNCAAVRWQVGIAALGYRLLDGTLPASAPPSTWERMMRQMGGNIAGAAVGQVVFGGVGGVLGGWLLGPRGALAFAGLGAVVGAVVGAVAGGELADGESPLRKGDLGPVTLRKLGGKLGEEAGWTTGAMVGGALAGPAGAVAGMAVGSILAGQAMEDLLRNQGQFGDIGRPQWLLQLGEEQAGERLSETLLRALGRNLSGGQEWGAQLGGRVGGSLGRKIDWAGSWSQHQLVSRIGPHTPQPAL